MHEDAATVRDKGIREYGRTPAISTREPTISELRDKVHGERLVWQEIGHSRDANVVSDSKKTKKEETEERTQKKKTRKKKKKKTKKKKKKFFSFCCLVLCFFSVAPVSF